MSDILLQCLRSISAVVDPLDHGLFELTLHSQNTWNAPAEIIPTWNLRNDLLDIYAKLKFPANCIVSASLFSLGSPKSNVHALRFAAVSPRNACWFYMAKA